MCLSPSKPTYLTFRKKFVFVPISTPEINAPILPKTKTIKSGVTK